MLLKLHGWKGHIILHVIMTTLGDLGYPLNQEIGTYSVG